MSSHNVLLTPRQHSQTYRSTRLPRRRPACGLRAAHLESPETKKGRRWKGRTGDKQKRDKEDNGGKKGEESQGEVEGERMWVRMSCLQRLKRVFKHLQIFSNVSIHPWRNVINVSHSCVDMWVITLPLRVCVCAPGKESPGKVHLANRCCSSETK